MTASTLQGSVPELPHGAAISFFIVEQWEDPNFAHLVNITLRQKCLNFNFQYQNLTVIKQL